MTSQDAKMLSERLKDYYLCRTSPKQRRRLDYHKDYDPDLLTMDLEWASEGLVELAELKFKKEKP